MNILHINTTSHAGGAARAMQRLHMTLKEKGHGSQLLVGIKDKPEDPEVHVIWDEIRAFKSIQSSIRSRIGNILEKKIGINAWAQHTNIYINKTPIYQWLDLIDLRNLFGGYFNLWSLPSLSRNKPVVWRLPDMWALTGGCAYPYSCDRWKTGCYECPLLSADGREIIEPAPPKWDGTKRIWKAKKELYNRSNLHIVTNSNWMMRQVRQGILQNALSFNVISNGVDLETYLPIDKKKARKKLGLPLDEKIVLWAAGKKGNYRKGYRFALEAMEYIQEKLVSPPWFITMGRQKGWTKPEPINKMRDFGFIDDPNKQALIYAAADVFLCTTLADAQPQTALESLACGTPIIAFDIGPMPEIVKNGKTGILVPGTESAALANALMEFLENEDTHPMLRENGRQMAEKYFDLENQTEKYINLYEKIIDDKVIS